MTVISFPPGAVVVPVRIVFTRTSRQPVTSTRSAASTQSFFTRLRFAVLSQSALRMHS